MIVIILRYNCIRIHVPICMYVHTYEYTYEQRLEIRNIKRMYTNLRINRFFMLVVVKLDYKLKMQTYVNTYVLTKKNTYIH